MKNIFNILILVVTLLPRNLVVADILVQPGYDQPQARVAYPSYHHVQQEFSDPVSNLYKYYWPHQYGRYHSAPVGQTVGFPLIHYPYHYRFHAPFAAPPRRLHLAKIGGLKIFEPSWYINNRVANPLAVQPRYKRSTNESSDPEATGKVDHMAANPALINLNTGKNIETYSRSNYNPLYTLPALFPAFQKKESNDQTNNENGSIVQQLNPENGAQTSDQKKITQRQISYEPNAALTSPQTEAENKIAENQSTASTLRKALGSSGTQVQYFSDPRSYKIMNTVPLRMLYGNNRYGIPNKFGGQSYTIPTTSNENLFTPENTYTSQLSPTKNYYYYSPYFVGPDPTGYQNTYGYPSNVETLTISSSQMPLTHYRQIDEMQETDDTLGMQYVGQPLSYNYGQRYSLPSHWLSHYSTFYAKPNWRVPGIFV